MLNYFRQKRELFMNFALMFKYLSLRKSLHVENHVVLNLESFSATYNQESLSAANFTPKVTDGGICFVFNDASNGLPPVMAHSAGKVLSQNWAMGNINSRSLSHTLCTVMY